MKEQQAFVTCVYAEEGQTAAELLEAPFRAFLNQQLAIPARSGQD